MATIITNKFNPFGLKLLLASKFNKNISVELKVVKPNDKSVKEPKHLPYLDVNDEIIFSSNAAAWFLFSVDNVKVNEWLEWECKVLAPNLANLLGVSTKNEPLKQVVTGNLKKLEDSLKTGYLIENKVSLADIIIWSTIYPLLKDKSCKDLLGDCPNITNWAEKLENLPEFKESIAEFEIDSANTCYGALLTGQKYFTASLSEQNASNQSPQHQIEAVTSQELEAAKKAFTKTLKDLPPLKKPGKVVLPKEGEKNIFITSALPYVNNVPHLGNIIGCVLSADVFARFSRLCNYNTLYICGTDEYGTATETKALEEGLSCQAICDKYYKIHNEIYQWFNISFDKFGRTSAPQQTQLCQEMFLKLNDNGFMFTQSVEQLHCEKCDRYLADRFVEGGCPNIGCNYEDARGDQCDGCGKLVNAVELKNPRCKICKNTPKLKQSTQFFIDLPKLEPLLYHWMKTSSPGWSNNAQVIAKSWMKEGLKPRCITRDLKWGVPVPLDGFRNKVFYVWFDAPIGYMSISKAYTDQYEKWWRPENYTKVTLYQFMAKDNVPFHAVLFPAMLLGANQGYVTVSHIMATEYLNYEDGKFSKSRGVGVFGTDAKSTEIPSDVWRFYLLYVRPESQDASFSWADLATKNNSELLNNLGNFVNRALVFAKNNFSKSVPEIVPNEDDFTLLALCTREYKNYVSAIEKGRLRDGIRHILTISRHGNQYMQANQPWVLLKGNDSEKSRAGTVIGICCNLACLLSVLLQPYMPEASANLQKQLNIHDVIINPESPEIINFLQKDHKLGEPSPLFTKIEPARVEELKKQFAGKQTDNSPSVSGDLKTIEAEVAKQADKVRAFKSSGAEKKVWQPEVDILLKLKKQLELAQKSNNPSNKSATANAAKENGAICNSDPDAAKKLAEKVAEQGLVVRKLKEGGADKSVWQPEVTKLLALKNELASLTGEPIQKSSSGKKGKK